MEAQHGMTNLREVVRSCGFDASVEEAVGRSFLASFPADSLHRLLSDALRLEAPAGSVIYRDADAPRAGLLVDGLIRVYLTSAEGRQVTVRYARKGELLGTAVTVGGPVRVSVQILVDSTLLMLNVRTFQAIAQADARVAWAVAEDVTRRLYGVLDAFAGTTFGSVRQRIARHLLDLASGQQRGRALLATVSQQELADATGTVREVVARALRDLRDGGIVETTKQGVVILDPARLHAEVEADESL